MVAATAASASRRARSIAGLSGRQKLRAAAHGRSTEEEHRQLLRQVLRPEGLGAALLAMPDVGADTDFERQSDLPRELGLR